MTVQWSNEDWSRELDELDTNLCKGRFDDQKQNVKIIGYGEISTILQFQQQTEWVVKRMPIFDSNSQAKKYLVSYRTYNILLQDAGINIPSHQESIIGENPVSLYLMQHAFNPEQIASTALQSADIEQQGAILSGIVQEIEKIFHYNQNSNSDYLLSCDGQSSNWAIDGDKIFYIDTSTPLFKKNFVEQLEYELLLKSTPSFLRGIIRIFFLKDVLDRYYQKKLVYIDLIANLKKEQLSHLIPMTIAIVNSFLENPLSEKDINQYYRQDKFIWQLFLSFRKLDRWLHHNLWHKPYQYFLPEKVQR